MYIIYISDELKINKNMSSSITKPPLPYFGYSPGYPLTPFPTALTPLLLLKESRLGKPGDPAPEINGGEYCDS